MDALDAVLMATGLAWQRVIADVSDMLDAFPPEDCTIENIADEIGQSEDIVEKALAWLEKAGEAEPID